jgi:hypothetical protein
MNKDKDDEPGQTHSEFRKKKEKIHAEAQKKS